MTAPESMGPQWDMRSTPARKTGGQGTLFGSQGNGVAPHLSDAARYPRGFTPERRHAIEDMMVIPGKGTGTKKLVSEQRAVEEFGKVLPDDHPHGRGVWIHTPAPDTHVIKDPAEQVALQRTGNKTTCPQCSGTGWDANTVPTHADTGRPVHELARGCWACGDTMRDVGRFGVKSSGMVSIKEGDQWLGKPDEKRAAGGVSGIVDSGEIIPKTNAHPWLHERGRADIIDTLARSTAPLEHIARVRRLAVSNVRSMGPNTVGTTNNFNEVNIKAMGSKKEVGPGAAEEASRTLIHEMGHVAGAFSDDHYKDEAEADAYRLQHYRADPRNKGEARGREWIYSHQKGDLYDPDKVTAPGESPEQRIRRVASGVADRIRGGVNKRPSATQLRLF